MMQGPPSAEKGEEKGWKGSRMISKRGYPYRIIKEENNSAFRGRR